MIDGQDVEVFKEPITDTGKKSKRGRLTLQMEEGVYRTFEKGTGDPDKVFLEWGKEEGEGGRRSEGSVHANLLERFLGHVFFTV